MKRFFVFMLFVSLVMVCAGPAMASVSPPDLPSADIDTWYSIEDTPQFLSVTLSGWPYASDYMIDGAYYQNDFTFIDGTYEQWPGTKFYDIEGSYLFDFGLFVALDCYRYSSGSNYSEFSLGYCWSWDDHGYLAGSLDYSVDYGIEDYEIDFKYRTDAMKILGDLYIDEDFEYFDLQAYLNFMITEDLVVGGDIDIESGGALDFSVGATWTPGDWVLDLYVDGDLDYYEISGMYYFGDLGLGLECDDDGDCTLKAKYEAGDSYFTLYYEPGTYDYFELAYTKLL